MGTVNYQTSDYITLASAPLYSEDYSEYAEEQAEETGKSVEAIIGSLMSLGEEDSWIAAKEAAEKTTRNEFWKLDAVPGYYEGSQVVIHNELPESITDEERQTALTEVDGLKVLLVGLVENASFLETAPGWCPKWSARAETLESIDRAAEEMREAVLSVPAWKEAEPA